MVAYSVRSSTPQEVQGQEVVMTTEEPDSITTLIYALHKHFIGDPKKLQDRNLEILVNLMCPKLHDFRWYKDMFLTKYFSKLIVIIHIRKKSFWRD